jgi:hypothetical protein
MNGKPISVRAIVVLGSLALAACTSNPSSGDASTSAGQGAGGATSSSSGQGAGGDCTSMPTFTDVLKHPLSGCSGFEPPCHNASAGELHIDPMDAKGTWKQLVNVKAWNTGGGMRVVPGDPASSFLYKKLINDLGPKQGVPMPNASGLVTGGGGWTELPKDEIEMVRCWIQGGAKED